jgi:hypothetical protein
MYSVNYLTLIYMQKVFHYTHIIQCTPPYPDSSKWSRQATWHVMNRPKRYNVPETVTAVFTAPCSTHWMQFALTEPSSEQYSLVSFSGVCRRQYIYTLAVGI